MPIPVTNSKIRAYMDLARIHFVFIWPIIFLAGLFMAFDQYGAFSWSITIKATLISTTGFEAAFILNDIVDIRYDIKDVDWDITRYWRPYGTRPLASGEVSKRNALIIFFVLLSAVATLIFTLPNPNRYYLYVIMAYTYGMEYFYQIIKRSQRLPIAQLLGRTDFMVFAMGGYLCYGGIDLTVVLYGLFFYTLAQVHLGINDLSDYNNDVVRKMNTVTTMYGKHGNLIWILVFMLLHFTLGLTYIAHMGGITYVGYCFACIMFTYIFYRLRKETTPGEAHRAVPLFHLTLLTYMLTIMAEAYAGF